MIDRRIPVPRRQDTDRRVADRRNPRRQFSDAPIRFLRAATTTAECVLEGELLDASSSGVRLLLGGRLEVGEKLLVEVRDGDRGCFNLTAEVVWCEPADDDRFEVGCNLCVDLSARQFDYLQRLSAREAAN